VQLEEAEFLTASEASDNKVEVGPIGSILIIAHMSSIYGNNH